MDFELKTLTLVDAVSARTDALVVLVRQDGKPGRDALSRFVADAVKAGDFEAKPGKLLAAYKPAGFKATRVILAGIGDGVPKSVRQAVAAAIGSIKGGPSKKVTVLFAAAPEAGAVRAAVLAAADCTYVSTTRSSFRPSALLRVVV
ncbi:MAG: hypothetical protein EOP93_21355 [Lysobacteraceae bacterium]|nr:MAG: hypothetical protein EOP93_21355 [Xanthomonadaceae bacterium]